MIIQKQKKAAGKFFIIILFILINSYAKCQCLKITDVFSIFTDKESPSVYGFTFENEINSIFYKSVDVPLSNINSVQTVNIGEYSDNQFKTLYLFDNHLLYLKFNSLDCFNELKNEVKKSVGLKVQRNNSENNNNVNIESYTHIESGTIIEFHQNLNNNQYELYLFDHTFLFLVEQKRKLIFENNETIRLVNEKLNLANQSLVNFEFENVKKLFNEVQEIAKNRTYSDESNDLINLFKSKYNLALADFTKNQILNLIKNDKYLEAKRKFEEYSKNNIDSKSIIQLGDEIKIKGVDFYTKKSTISTDSKLYDISILYIDSALVLDSKNIILLEKKKEIISIKNFLSNRSASTFDFWNTNINQKQEIFDYYKGITLKEANFNKSGNISYILKIQTDTNCNIYSSIIWNTQKIDNIYFGKNEISNFKLLPLKHFDYCAKSEGDMPISITWRRSKYEFKFYNKKFLDNNIETKVEKYMVRNYSNLSGKILYEKLDYQLNNETQEVIYLSKFKTRGPLNSLYSFIIPGLGSLRVSYGKKGYTPLTLFVLGVTSIAVGGNSQLTSLGVLSISTAMVWDFTYSIIRGSKNKIYSKTFRKLLRKNGRIEL